MQKSFTKKTALIIGGSSGIGKETARQLLKKEAEKVIITGREQKKLQEAKAHLENCKCNAGGSVEIRELDLQNQESIEKFIQSIEKTKIDLLVNSAGYFNPKSFLEHQASDYDIYMAFNRGFFFITQQVAKNMKETQNGGAIVNVGSMWAHQAIKATPSSAYSMAKAGLHSLTQHLAMELAPYKIRVNAEAPAVVKTPIYEGFIEKDKVEETLKSFDSFHPLERVGTPEDVANVITFLLNEKASWITGTTVNVDGGVMAGRN